MSSSYKLVCQYVTSDGGSTTHSFPYAMSDLSTQAVNTFMNTIITNGSIFKKVPVSKKAAYLIETEQTDFSIT